MAKDNAQKESKDETDNSNGKIMDSTTKRTDKTVKNKGDLLSTMLNCFFDAAELNDLDIEKVNTIIKDVQYLFKKAPKHRDNKCFICGKD